MTTAECADILRSAIQHRERINENLFAAGPNGEELRIEHPDDILLDAMKFALVCVEEKIDK